MEFGLSKEQTLLQESVSRQLARVAPLARVKQFVDGGAPRATDVWAGVCELGLGGLLVGEEHGGIGCRLFEAALVAETLGSFVAPVPFAATAVMVPLALAQAGSEAQQARWLPALAEGRAIAGAALSELVGRREDAGVAADDSAQPRLRGRALFVLDFEADVYLVADRSRALYLVESNAAGLTRQRLITIDKTRSLGELVFDGVAAERLPGSADTGVCERVIDAGRIVLAADTLGAAQHMLARSVAYSKERIQFGRPVGSFQAVKHLCAEMAAELVPCQALMWYAAHAFDTMPNEARLLACHLKAHLAEVGTFVARTATEVHGGIGFTDELGLHLWFKRIGANRQLLGTPERVRDEAARLQQLA